MNTYGLPELFSGDSAWGMANPVFQGFDKTLRFGDLDNIDIEDFLRLASKHTARELSELKDMKVEAVAALVDTSISRVAAFHGVSTGTIEDAMEMAKHANDARREVIEWLENEIAEEKTEVMQPDGGDDGKVD